jgi:GT2 family glycosyltransferase
VTVVIPTRDRPQRLRSCLESILDADYPSSSLEVIVVDNAPTGPATKELLEDRFGHLPNVRYVMEPRAGSAIARNRGLSEAGSRIVAFVDDDVIVDRLWLRSLVDGFQAAPRVASVTSLILPAELETAPQVWIEEFGGFDKGYERRIYDLDEHAPPDPLYPYTMGRFGSGAAMAFDRGVLADLGGFDPVLHRGQDIDALLRVVLAGHRLVYEPSSVVRHYHHRDYDNLRKTMHGYGAGLSAVLTKTMLHREHCMSVLRRAPRGLAYLLRPSSGKNQQKSASYPRELTALELLGVLSGPLAYFRRRRRAR